MIKVISDRSADSVMDVKSCLWIIFTDWNCIFLWQMSLIPSCIAHPIETILQRYWVIYTRILQIRNMMAANQNIKSRQISVTPRGVKRQMTKDNSIKYLSNPYKAHYAPEPPISFVSLADDMVTDLNNSSICNP